MSLRINYNLASSSAQRGLASSQDLYSRMASRLSTGLRINQAADDTAGMAVSEKLKNQVRGLNQAQRNAQDGVSMLQTAEGALAETHYLLGRIRELAVQAANDTLTSADRTNLQAEANQLVSEIDRIASSTQFNGITLLDKNNAVSLHNAGSGLSFQIGANNGNTFGVNISAVRARDLGDVSTINAIDSAATTGAKTVSIGGSSINYNTAVDTIFDLSDAINAGTSTHGVTASIISSGGNTTSAGGNTPYVEGSAASGAHLKLTSAAADAFASDTGALALQLFGSATATTAQVAARSASTLADLGVSAGGTLTIGTSAAAAVGGTTLANLGVTAGTLSFTATVAAGVTGAAAGTATLAEIGISANGNFGMTLTAGGAVTVAYTTSDTLATFAAAVETALQAANGGANAETSTATYTAGTGFVFTINSASSPTTFTTAAFTAGTGHLAKLGLDVALGSANAVKSGTNTVTTAAQSEVITRSYATSDDLTTLASNIQAALRAGGVVGNSTLTGGTLAGATASFASGVISIDAVGANVTFSAITDSGTARSVLGGLAAGSGTTATATISPVATEDVTVAFATTDTIGTLTSNIQTAMRAAGATGSSLLGSLGSATAAFASGILTIATADSDVTIATLAASGGGGLIAKLGLAASPAAVQAASSAALTEDKYTLYSKTVTGVTSLVSGSSSNLDLSTQAAASAAIATVDAAVNQVSTARANLGAMQSRLESASRSIAVASENTAAANSRIADADIAQSMSEMVRAQILQQAGISVLAQANQAPSLVLQLLR